MHGKNSKSYYIFFDFKEIECENEKRNGRGKTVPAENYTLVPGGVTTLD